MLLQTVLAQAARLSCNGQIKEGLVLCMQYADPCHVGHGRGFDRPGQSRIAVSFEHTHFTGDAVRLDSLHIYLLICLFAIKIIAKGLGEKCGRGLFDAQKMQF